MAEFFDNYGALLAQGTIDTLVMTIASCLFAYMVHMEREEQELAARRQMAEVSPCADTYAGGIGQGFQDIPLKD